MNDPDLAGVSQIIVTGQRVTLERHPGGWIATGWEQSLPVARRPVTDAQVAEILLRFPNCAFRY